MAQNCNCKLSFKTGGEIQTPNVKQEWDIDTITEFIEVIGQDDDYEVYEDHKGTIRGYCEGDFGTVTFFLMNHRELRLVFDDLKTARAAFNSMSSALAEPYEFSVRTDMMPNVVMVNFSDNRAFENGGWLQDGDSNDMLKKQYTDEIKDATEGIRYCNEQIAVIGNDAKEQWAAKEYKQVIQQHEQRIAELKTLLNQFESGGDLVAEKETIQQYFNLPDATSVETLDSNIMQILHQYSGREMASIQVESYLNENVDLAKQWLAKNGIKTRDDLKSLTARMQAKARQGKGLARREFLEEIKREKTDRTVAQIESMALAAGKEMDERIKREYADQFAEGGVIIDYKDFVKSFEKVTSDYGAFYRSLFCQKNGKEIYIIHISMAGQKTLKDSYILVFRDTDNSETQLGEHDTLNHAIRQAYSSLGKLEKEEEVVSKYKPKTGDLWANPVTDKSDKDEIIKSEKILQSFDGCKVQLEYFIEGALGGGSKRKEEGVIRVEYFNDFPEYRHLSVMFFKGHKTTKYQTLSVSQSGGSILKVITIDVLKTGLINRDYPDGYVSKIIDKTNIVLEKMANIQYNSQYDAYIDLKTQIEYKANAVMNGYNDTDKQNVKEILDKFEKERDRYTHYRAAKDGSYLKYIQKGEMTVEKVMNILNSKGIEIPEDIFKLSEPKKETPKASPKQAWEMTRNEFYDLYESDDAFWANGWDDNDSRWDNYKEAKRLAKTKASDVLPRLDAAKTGERNKAIYHRSIIENALSEGKPVPAEVLADYPELKKQDENLESLIKIMDSRIKNQGYSLKQVYDEVLWGYGSEQGKLIFSEFIKRKKDEGDRKIINEFNRTSFVENINAPEASPKEAWEMTRSEWYKVNIVEFEQLNKDKFLNKYGASWFNATPVLNKKKKILHEQFHIHKNAVKQALSEGKTVPPEVLADYPEFKKQEAPDPETQEITEAIEALQALADLSTDKQEYMGAIEALKALKLLI